MSSAGPPRRGSPTSREEHPTRRRTHKHSNRTNECMLACMHQHTIVMSMLMRPTVMCMPPHHDVGLIETMWYVYGRLEMHARESNAMLLCSLSAFYAAACSLLFSNRPTQAIQLARDGCVQNIIFSPAVAQHMMMRAHGAGVCRWCTQHMHVVELFLHQQQRTYSGVSNTAYTLSAVDDIDTRHVPVQSPSPLLLPHL